MSHTRCTLGLKKPISPKLIDNCHIWRPGVNEEVCVLHVVSFCREVQEEMGESSRSQNKDGMFSFRHDSLFCLLKRMLS